MERRRLFASLLFALLYVPMLLVIAAVRRALPGFTWTEFLSFFSPEIFYRAFIPLFLTIFLAMYVFGMKR